MKELLSKISKYNVFLTYLLGNLGLAIIFPIFTPLLYDTHYTIFKHTPSITESSIVLGFLIAAFPLAQFFGAPLIGDLSDQIGRKKAFLISITGSAIGYIILSIAIVVKYLPMLFLGRMISGFFAGNLSICTASLVDMSHDHVERAKNISLLATISGISFIVSVAIGGIFSDPNLSHRFSPSLPFWILSFLFGVNLLFVIAFFKESHVVESNQKFHLLKGIHHIADVWQVAQLKTSYLVYFFFITSWTATMQFLPPFLTKYYLLSPQQITDVYVGFGFFWSLANFIYSKFFTKLSTPKLTLSFSLGLLSIFTLVFMFLSQLSLTSFIIHLYLCVMVAAISWANCLTNVSFQADLTSQGKILGVNQSFSALAGIIGPIFAGIISGDHPKFIFLFASISCFLSFCILLKKFSLLKPHSKP
jgi:DHA1 family tetracycline resistance protein-like MFS transporter